MYDLDKDILHYFAMTLIIDLKNWFKVTAHPLTKGSGGGGVKYELDWAKGKYASDK